MSLKLTCKKIRSIVHAIDLVAILLMVSWIIFFPLIWVYSRFYPRIPSRILLWTNEGFIVAPSRVRCYYMARELLNMGFDAEVLSFYDHLAHHTGLPPLPVSLGQRTWITFRAMIFAIRHRCGIIVAQRPFYEFISLISLKLLYPLSLNIWIDIDDWIFDYGLENSSSSVNFRDTLLLHLWIYRGCIVSSLHLQQEMTRYFKRLEVIPTFPDANAFSPSIVPLKEHDNSRVVFLWMGTLLVRHHVDDVLFLVHALESLKDRRITFQLVGGGDYFNYAFSEAKKTSKHVTVSFLGWQSPDSIPRFISLADVGLYCLMTRNDFMQSKSPTKLFEYMACGKPSIATDYGEASRFIEHGETGFLASNLTEFSNYCQILANDSQLRKTMGEKARRKIELEYNSRQAAKKLSRIILDAGTASRCRH